MSKILLTGGAGFIGSHTAVELIERGFEVVIYDNLTNSEAGVTKRIARIAGAEPKLIEGDIRETEKLEAVLRDENIAAVIHFAGLKAVGESTSDPIKYYDQNVAGSISLLKAMETTGVHQLIFSSSATVYGDPDYVPIDEHHRRNPANVYGRTKSHIEEILADIAASDPKWKFASLRYFNPVGAHESGLIGEDPKDIPNNLMPYIARVAAGQLECLTVFGDDYETPDGTGVRDYIHVVDLARGHVAAMGKLESQEGMEYYNLGTGKGSSVLEVIAAYKSATNADVKFQIGPRRPGDVASYFASPQKAQDVLEWKAERDLREMCFSSWNFQNKLAQEE